MKKETNAPGFVNIGTSLLMVVFLALSLVTFAVLALSSARTDHTFSETLADHRAAYYTASNRAEEILAELDAILESTDGSPAALAEALENFTAADGTPVLFDADAMTLSYTVPADDRQALSVRLSVTAESGMAYCTVEAWQLESAADWSGDNTLQLLPIENEA